MSIKKIDNTTFRNSNKEFEVEIGDIFSGDFQPQVKIKRWDNECNFSVRLIDNEPDIPQIVVKADKIKYIKNKIEAHFYEISKDKDNPDRYEFEVILKEDPRPTKTGDYKVEMSIETKGLDFFYQPELTLEELSEGIYRPQNIIGSYAVYHKSKSGDYEQLGGKNYRAGKAFHIYRPKIFDSKGSWIWGELNIDEKKGILSVTIPQEFLDNAVYPIRHASGLTFGYETAGTTGDTGLQNRIVGSVFTGAVGTGVNLIMHHNPSSVDHTTKCAIYIHNTSGLLTNGTTDVITGVTGEAWRTYAFTSAPTLDAVDYVLVGWSNNIIYQTNAISYDAGNVDQGHYDDETYNGFPATATFSHVDNKYSIYCTYTAGGAATPTDKFFLMF